MQKKIYSINIKQYIYILTYYQYQFYNISIRINKQIFSLKWVSNIFVNQQNIKKHLLQELYVQRNVKFQFIVQHIKFFNYNENYIYLNEYIQGDDMSSQLYDCQNFKITRCQFYIAQLILCLEYLHKNNIIYRDLKPENIMIDKDGYIKLVDMGTCKFLDKNTFGRTQTIIGTAFYMAPEVILAKSYSYYVDLWSLGIISYEFLCGFVPFDFDNQNPSMVYQNIIRKKLQFPYFLQKEKSSY
ncbi:hypothetical protein IMG5_185390 [Ichthyophthirius multifiliis]|uniref:Protein kinase domain-containing protein n=1 Tax=Ichthyophthirius multifiliis TaxID=5932 RepID=G0R3G7_ICHMU|nr:hypothetical protein IMG5_185390 [Ichthyophthirius multifiliis]EGR27956.1 hypothetical protein IMG5_185390 [Ichthyophthirius multifiliis]|eukprot:XP_004027301.1 hypothetical protein IMG5_185390 [Ichthyophthirius multifiliis]